MKNILVYGVFDMLHSGHINLLYRASQLGEVYVMIFSSDHVYKTKGKKTVYSDEERLSMIKSLIFIKDCFIVENIEDGSMGKLLEDAISRYSINKVCLGGDHDTKEIKNWIESFGVQFVPFDRTKNISTTKLRNSIEK